MSKKKEKQKNYVEYVISNCPIIGLLVIRHYLS